MYVRINLLSDIDRIGVGAKVSWRQFFFYLLSPGSRVSHAQLLRNVVSKMFSSKFLLPREKLGMHAGTRPYMFLRHIEQISVFRVVDYKSGYGDNDEICRVLVGVCYFKFNNLSLKKKKRKFVPL